MSNAVANLPDRPRRELAQTEDVVPILDTAKFEHMQRVAHVMASTSMIPDALCKEKVDGQLVYLPMEQIRANCFLVVNQSVRWGMDPFAVAQCVSLVHGKLCYEGKLVSAVLDAKLGLKLHHHMVGDAGSDGRRIYLSDRPFDTEISVVTEGRVEKGPLSNFLTPGFRNPAVRIFDGSVGEWKTTGSGTPWTPKNYDRMLVYRGTRDWCRIYEPAIMLGVYTPDEMLDLSENMRANRARDVTGNRPALSDRLSAAKAQQKPTDAREGFDRSFIDGELRGDVDASSDQDERNSDEAAGAVPDGAETGSDTGSVSAEQTNLGTHSQESVDSSQGSQEVDIDPADERDDPTISEADRVKLGRYAHDLFGLAAGEADPGIRKDRIGKAHTRWREDIAALPEEAREMAAAILKSAQAVNRGDTSVESAAGFHADMLGLPAADLTPGVRHD
ncbi:hypothetical protein [Consotaella aegiceratis]|uniref:hypothetical protein n=1 Tax=Consotaella aegiceratis TaxID=3097961 RepID=UPI002F3FCAF2